MSTISNLKNKFQEVFNTPAEHVFFSPGRVNLIGEYTDFNGGLVFPCAIDLGTYGATAFNSENKIRLYSLNFEDAGLIEIDLSQDLETLKFDKADNWANYVKGMVKYTINKNAPIRRGFDLMIYGTLPNGAGLSSSASLEMLIGKILVSLFKMDISPVEMSLIGKKVENKFIGVNSGIMDQFAIALGKKDNAIELDCNTLHYTYAPLNFENESIVIMNTNKRRELSDSKYNERRSECESALSQLNTKRNMSYLCEISLAEFNEVGSVITNEIDFKRARHIISENERVKNAVVALNQNDLVEFGRLLTASHTSLRDDFDVTGHELDTLVAAALNHEGVFGARMTGAGFGGCAIALVKNDNVDDFIKSVGAQYLKEIGYEASFYIANTSDCPKEII